MHCSNKSSGCCAKATIKPLNSIVKKKCRKENQENDYSTLTFINPHSRENFKIENYDAETIGMPRRKADWREHTCNGYVAGKNRK